MTEQETLQRAIMYLETLSEGMNPLNGAEIPSGEVLCEARISRCLKYAAEQLTLLLGQGEKKQRLQNFYILDVQLEALEASNRTLTTTQLTEKINRVTEENDTRKFQARWILDWLTEQGLLEINNSVRLTTEAGKMLGITAELVENPTSHIVMRPVYFTSEAQRFVFDHLREMIPQKQSGTSSSKPRPAFFITELQKGQLSPLEYDCTVSQLAAEINRVTEDNGTFKFKAQWINSWLIEIGMLEEKDGQKQATADGFALGIISLPRINEKGTPYIANKYTSDAQCFILDNLDAVLAFAADCEEAKAKK